RPAAGRERVLPDPGFELARPTVIRDHSIKLSIALENERLLRLAQPRRRLYQRVEHCLQVEGRAADDLEHVGGGGSLLQRFAQPVEQARVLDGDDGLGGEVLYQLDLLVYERPDFLPIDANCADQLILLDHRGDKEGANTGKFNESNN